MMPAAAITGSGSSPSAPLAGGILTGKYRDGVPADSRGADEATAPRSAAGSTTARPEWSRRW